MDKAFNRVPVWVWLLLAAIFILSQVVPCRAFDQSEVFWTKQPCGFKQVEINQGAVPEKIWYFVDELVNKCKKQHQVVFGTKPVDGRIFSYHIENYQIANDIQVISIIIRQGGKVIYSGGEKICQ